MCKCRQNILFTNDSECIPREFTVHVVDIPVTTRFATPRISERDERSICAAVTFVLEASIACLQAPEILEHTVAKTKHENGDSDRTAGYG